MSSLVLSAGPPALSSHTPFRYSPALSFLDKGKLCGLALPELVSYVCSLQDVSGLTQSVSYVRIICYRLGRLDSMLIR